MSVEVQNLFAPSPGYVVVEGPIGVGKTSLARRLAESFECELLLEKPAENPFLERFYQSPRQYALPTQLFFLFQRARQLEQLQQTDMFSPRRVSDFLLEKDILFAESNLDDDEMRLYEQVYKQLAPNVPQPDLVIYLQAPADVLMQRVRWRGIDFERNIELEYLERLCEAYARFFFSYKESPLLMVNAADINLVDSDEDYNVLLDYLSQVKNGRHFLNPLPEHRT